MTACFLGGFFEGEHGAGGRVADGGDDHIQNVGRHAGAALQKTFVGRVAFLLRVRLNFMHFVLQIAFGRGVAGEALLNRRLQRMEEANNVGIGRDIDAVIIRPVNLPPPVFTLPPM